MDTRRLSASREPLTEGSRFQLLFADLKASGFSISPDIEAHVTGFFLNITLSKQRPHSNRRLGNLLGPLICRSAEEQKEFQQIFAYWFPDTDSVTENTTAQLPIDANQENAFREACTEAEEEAARLRKERKTQEFWKRVRSFIPVFLVILTLSIVLQIVFVETDTPAESTTEPSTPLPQPEEDTKPQDTTEQPMSVSEPEMTREQPDKKISSILTDIEAILGPATTLVIMIPLGILALLITSSSRLLRSYAKRTQASPRKQFRHLLSEGISETSLLDKKFYATVQLFRRRIRTFSTQLDIDRTVEATASSGGLFSPKFSGRDISPEYLVLVDRRSENDHFASLAELFTRHMALAGVHTTIYNFDRDPRIVSLAGSDRRMHLEEILRSDLGVRLIVFSDLVGFYDASLGQPREFCRTLLAEIPTILMTPKAIEDWGRREFLIEKVSAATVVPSTEHGLSMAAVLFTQKEQAPNNVTLSATQGSLFPERSRLEGRFAVAEWRWIGELEPRNELLDPMMAQLKSELSEDAWFWLASLAIYPLMYWSLTLYLAAHLTGRNHRVLYRQETLMEIIRLPWLIRGKMPSWLRRRFIQELSLDQRQQVRTVLEGLLMTVASRDSKDVVLGISFNDPKEFRSHRRSKDPEAQEHSRDSILIDFMTTHEASEEDFSLSEKVFVALGLHHVGLMKRTLFSNKAEREMMRASANKCNNIVKDASPKDIEVRPLPTDQLGHGVYEIAHFSSEPNDLLKQSQTFFLFKENPNLNYFQLIDKYSLSILDIRKKLVWKFASVTMIVLTLLIGVLYADWFPSYSLSSVVNSSLSQLYVLSYILAAILAAPFFIYRWFIYRPFDKLLQTFPRVEAPKEQQTQVSQGRIRDVWYGQRSLAQTFWLWGVLVNGMLFGAIGAGIASVVAEVTEVFLLLYVYVACVHVPLTVWTIVGTWRSASNHPGFWATMVKSMIVMSMVIPIGFSINSLQDIESSEHNTSNLPSPKPPEVVEKEESPKSKESNIQNITEKHVKQWNPKIYRGERSYSKNSANTVKDNYTGLIWQKAGSDKEMTWEAAKRHCQELSLDGYSDWRLPAQEELYYLGDVTKSKPAIDTNYFNVKSTWYWSSTTYKNDSSSAWGVDFGNGVDRWLHKSNTLYALCVR